MSLIGSAQHKEILKYFTGFSAQSQLHILTVYAKIRKAFTIGGVLSDGTEQ